MTDPLNIISALSKGAGPSPIVTPSILGINADGSDVGLINFSYQSTTAPKPLPGQCDLVGTSIASPPEITGTVFNITPAMTMADVRAINASPGDGVLFEAGGTWLVTGDNDRLLCQAGVSYGRYGAGANPLIDGTGTVFSQNFRGIIEVNTVNDTIIDGLDITWRGGALTGFLFWAVDSTNVTVRNLTAFDNQGGGVVFTRADTILVQNIHVHDVMGAPHESITFSDSHNFLVDSVLSVNNDKAAVNSKDGSSNGEVRFSEFSATRNDPMVYVDRASNIRYHHNFIHGISLAAGATFKPMLSVGLEGLGDPLTRYNRNIEYDNNVIFTVEQVAMKVSIKFDAFDGVTKPSLVMDNIKIHHNTIVRTNQVGQTFQHGLNVTDNRTPEVPSDWTNIVIENNIFWEIGNSPSINISGIVPVGVNRFNLFETGATGDLGTNSVITSDVMFIDIDGANFTLASGSPAKNAGSDGLDIGASIEPMCPNSN